jgi:predicted Zn-dependent peptidase
MPAFLDLDVEKGIVCDEILEDLDDEGRQVDADNLSRALVYPDHPLGFTITGDERHVRSFDRRILEAHHARHYTAGSCVLVYSGAVESSRAFDLAARDFGAARAGAPVTSPAPVHTQTKPRLLIVPNTSSQTELRLCFRALAEHAPERPALELLMRVIDDGMSTRLYQRICDDRGLCYDVSAGYEGYEDDGVVDFAAGVAHSRVAKIAGEIRALLGELAEAGPTREELEKAQRRQAWDTRAIGDSPEDLGAFYGLGTLWGHPESPEEHSALLARVTAEEVRDVARLLASPARLNVVAVGLLGKDEQKRLADVVHDWPT